MSDNSWAYGLLDVIDLIAKNNVNHAGYDTTIIGTIAKNKSASGAYLIESGGAQYSARAIEGTVYNPGDFVYAILPANDQTQIRLILGKVDTTKVLDKQVDNPEQAFNYTGPNLFLETVSLSNSNSTWQKTNSNVNIDGELDLAKSKLLLCQGKLTIGDNSRSEVYGLKFTFQIDGNTEVYQDFTLNDVLGDPYNLNG